MLPTHALLILVQYLTIVLLYYFLPIVVYQLLYQKALKIHQKNYFSQKSVNHKVLIGPEKLVAKH